MSMPPPTCANPLLLGWIKELHDLAVERSTKGVTTYQRAYNAMKACPLTFSHPSEAQQLTGIGPKICESLTDKLKEHCEANGLPAPKKPRGKARKRLTPEDLVDVEEPVPAKRPRKPKLYVPSLRSGSYAIILALSSLPDDSLQSLTKAQLIDRAQEHCDSSFTVPSESGKFYTAWNSMRTLVDKDMVHEKGRPLRKYALTDEGWEVAKRIRAAQGDEAVSETAKANTVRKSKETEATGVFGKAVRASNNVHGFFDLEEATDLGESLPKPKRNQNLQRSTKSNSGPAGQRLGGAPVDRYGTLSRAREPTPNRQEVSHDFVDFTSSPESQLAVHMPWPSSRLTQDSRQLDSRQPAPFQPNFIQAMSISSATGTLSEPLQPNLAQELDTPLHPTSSNSGHRANPKIALKPPSPKPFQPNFAQAMNVTTLNSGNTPKLAAPEPFQPSFDQAMNATSNSASTAPPDKSSIKRPSQNPKPMPSELSQPCTAQTKNDPSVGAPSKKPTSMQPDSMRATSAKPPTPSSSALPTFTPVPIQPGTFTVQLVLDNREVRAKDDRDYISDQLTKKGAKPLVRPLELGDFFWVAKMRSPSLLSQYGEEGDEIALDWIVERKRLDDLVGSITDGRFQEQRFRLRKSGVKNVTYLIEEFSISNEKATKFHEAILSAIASTQVVNGYFVKQTRKLDDTIDYLARMTRMLKSIYESKPLYLIPTSALTPTTYLPLLSHLRTDPAHKDRSYNITYQSFASLSSKSDTLTLRDVFLKMLMCTKGISGDKALAIQKQWTTPRAFFEAFEACASEKERDALVETKLGGIVGRGKIKGILGTKVAKVWGEK